MAEKQYFGRHFSIWPYTVGNGSKSFGGSLWFNSQRVGLELKFWVWEIQFIWDFK